MKSNLLAERLKVDHEELLSSLGLLKNVSTELDRSDILKAGIMYDREIANKVVARLIDLESNEFTYSNEKFIVELFGQGASTKRVATAPPPKPKNEVMVVGSPPKGILNSSIVAAAAFLKKHPDPKNP